MPEVEPDLIHQQVREFFLFFRGKVTVSDAVVHLRLFIDALQERHYARTKLIEELVACLHVKAFLIFVQPVIVRILIRFYVLRKLLVRIEDLLEIRTEELKIRSLFRPVPHVVGHYYKFLICDVFIRRDLLHVADVLEQQIHHALLIRTEFILVSVKEFQKLYGLFGCALSVDLF